ncbi:Conserved_hypothetical protein [Hexamita inflata]|uniref:Uncharacterized protein n=1 Tax=Hexamita inflata TaxID=28002 RepID=A0AA86P7A3_9EUKA|nr:Conserved hypothetical protein [Hexamita inflata]
MMLKGKQLLSKLMKTSYVVEEDFEVLLDKFKLSLDALKADVINECPAIFDYTSAFSALISSGLSSNQSTFTLCAAICKQDETLSKVLANAYNQIYLDTDYNGITLDAAKQYTMFQIIARFLLAHGLLAKFIMTGSYMQDKLELTYYQNHIGIFLSQELRDRAFYLANQFEKITRQINFSADVRFYRIVNSNQQELLDEISTHFSSLPQRTISFREESKQIQADFISFLAELKVHQLISILDQLYSQLKLINAGKEAINQYYLKAAGMSLKQEEIAGLMDTIQKILETMANCGAKVKMIQIKALFQKVQSFGELQYQLFIVRFLLADPLLMAVFFAYLGGNMESDIPNGHIFVRKALSDEHPIANSIFCTQLSILIVKDFLRTGKHFINVNYLGCFYQNYFSIILQQMMTDSNCGQLLISSLLENIATIYLEKQKTHENTEVLVFFFISVLIEIKENLGGKFITWFQKSNIKEKDQILAQLKENQDETEDELNYKLMFSLLQKKALSQLFYVNGAPTRISSLVVRFEQYCNLSDVYLSSAYIQKQRLIFIQIIYHLYNRALQCIYTQINETTRPKELANYVGVLVQQFQSMLELIQHDSQYINELFNMYQMNDAIKFTTDIQHFLGLIELETPQIVNNIKNIVKLIIDSRQITSDQMEMFSMYMMVFEQTGFMSKDLTEVISTLLQSILPQTKRNEVPMPQKYHNLYHLIDQLKQFSEQDRLEAFNRGLLLTSSLADLLELFTDYNVYLRKFYSYDAFIVNLSVIDQLKLTVLSYEFDQYEYQGSAKKLHSFKPYVFAPFKRTASISIQKPQNSQGVTQEEIDQQFGRIYSQPLTTNIDIDMSQFTMSKLNTYNVLDELNEINEVEDRKLEQKLKEQKEAKAEAAKQEALKNEAAKQEALKAEAAKQEALKNEAAKQEALKAEAAKQEALKNEAAKQEALKAEAAKQEALKNEAAKQEALKAEAAKQEALKNEAAKQEALKAEAAKQEALKNEAAKQEALKAEAAKQEALKAEAAKQEALKAEAAKQEALQNEAAKQEALKAEAAKQEALKNEAAKQEALKAEAAKQEALKAEAAKQEALKAEAAKQEALKAEAAKQEALKAEAAKQEALKAEAAKQEALKAEAAKQEDIQVNSRFQPLEFRDSMDMGDMMVVQAPAMMQSIKIVQPTEQLTPTKVLDIPAFPSSMLRLLGHEVNSSDLLQIQFILENQHMYPFTFSKPLPLPSLSEFFGSFPPLPASSPYLHSDQVTNNKSELSLEQLHEHYKAPLFTKSEVKSGSILIETVKALELLRIVKLYAHVNQPEIRLYIDSLANLQNTKLTLQQILNIFNPQPTQFAPDCFTTTRQFVTKSEVLKAYYVKNTHLPAHAVFNATHATNSPLSVLGFIWSLLLAYQDQFEDCQTKNCCHCGKTMSTFKYKFATFEKLATGGKLGTAMCPVCLRFAHAVCMGDGMCADCQKK